MPRSTVSQPFEWRLFFWASHLRGGAGFLVVLGETTRIIDADHESRGNRLVSVEKSDEVRQNAACWIFFDPFDAPEYTWLAWQGVTPAMWKQLTGEDLGEIPESHGVMF